MLKDITTTKWVTDSFYPLKFILNDAFRASTYLFSQIPEVVVVKSKFVTW
jgi:hypothetical protein